LSLFLHLNLSSPEPVLISIGEVNELKTTIDRLEKEKEKWNMTSIKSPTNKISLNSITTKRGNDSRKAKSWSSHLLAFLESFPLFVEIEFKPILFVEDLIEVMFHIFFFFFEAIDGCFELVDLGNRNRNWFQ
jgi:hypothetical protein